MLESIAMRDVECGQALALAWMGFLHRTQAFSPHSMRLSDNFSMTMPPSIDPCPAEAAGYATAWHHSAFARRALPGVMARGQLLDARAAITPAVLHEHFNQLWADVLRVPSAETVTVALRQFRNSALLAIMARDLAGTADLNESLESITALADMAINAAYASAMAAAIVQHGTPRDSQGQPQDMMIIGMGKLGGRELNASSDVDLIYIYPDDGETDAAPANSRAIDSASLSKSAGALQPFSARSPPMGSYFVSIYGCGPMATRARLQSAWACWSNISSCRDENGNATPGSRPGS